jgi:hypothetical protein
VRALRSKIAKKLLCDKAYDSVELGSWLKARETKLVVPTDPIASGPPDSTKKNLQRYRIEHASFRLRNFPPHHHR